MPDKIDVFLDVASTPDWISPLTAIVQDLVNGPRHDYYVDAYAGRSVNDVKRLLKRNGVKVWGAMLFDDMITFTVKEPQARWAQYVLERAGITIHAGQVVEQAYQPHGTFERPAAGPARQRVTGFQSLFDWLDELGEKIG